MLVLFWPQHIGSRRPSLSEIWDRWLLCTMRATGICRRESRVQSPGETRCRRSKARSQGQSAHQATHRIASSQWRHPCRRRGARPEARFARRPTRATPCRMQGLRGRSSGVLEQLGGHTHSRAEGKEDRAHGHPSGNKEAGGRGHQWVLRTLDAGMTIAHPGTIMRMHPWWTHRGWPHRDTSRNMQKPSILSPGKTRIFRISRNSVAEESQE